MAELADALDSKSGAFGRVGSTPTLGIFLTSLTSGVFLCQRNALFYFWGTHLRWPGSLLLGGTTSVSSATDKEKSDRIISSSSVLDFHVISKVPTVDTEVDPP